MCAMVVRIDVWNGGLCKELRWGGDVYVCGKDALGKSQCQKWW